MWKFDKYKNRLLDYLRLKGIEEHDDKNLIHCFNPNHEDRNPSCEVYDFGFYCHSAHCGIRGDIYDAIGILEGITDKRKQFEFAEKLFKGAENA